MSEHLRTIVYEDIVEAVKRLCIEAAHELPDDVVEALKRAERVEGRALAKRTLSLFLENAQVARDDLYPLCQDTGVTVVFVEQGNAVTVSRPADGRDAGLVDAITEGVAAGYDQGVLRKSMVDDPIDRRENTKDNTPAIVHQQWTTGDALKLSVMLKGGGCENRSRFKMLTPAQGQAGVEEFVVDTVRQAGADACPPFVVGVGVGGDFEVSCLLAKKALLRRIGSVNANPFYAGLENSLLEQINALNIGPQGMGGNATALAVLIEHRPCHIASLPVAVNIECHSHRHKSVVL